MQIPRIEIDNYVVEKESETLDDIDVLFYSPYTNILYVVEYKNYQMYVTGNQKISSDILKLKREKTIPKMAKRRRYVVQHKENILNDIFHMHMEVVDCEVVSLILTTKPNFYFFVNSNGKDDFLGMEWIEFKEKIEQHKL